MHSPVRVTSLVIAILWSAATLAQTPAEIFQEVDSRKRASLAGIDNYSQTKTTMGLCVFEYFEKATTEATDGRGTVAYMRNVPVSEITQRQSGGNALSSASPEELEHAANVIRQQGPAMEQGMRDEMQSAQIPGGIDQMLMNSPEDKPWLSANPNDMMGMYGTMLEGAAEGKRQAAQQAAKAEQDAKSDPMAQMAERTRVAGRETVNNRQAIKLVAEDLNYTQPAEEGATFTMNTMHIWIDAEKYVPLRMQIDGVVQDQGETRQMRIERDDMSYETVPGCGSMYEPMRSVMRISGVMSAQEQAQMAEAQAQMAQMEAQLASMPAAQKEMIMRQMGPQLEMFRNMAAGKGMEVVTTIMQMRCNTGLPDPMELSRTMGQGLTGTCRLSPGTAASPPTGVSPAISPGPASGSTDDASAGGVSGGLTAMVQQQLEALGYDPGNTNGEMTKQTAIAITQFQAANGLEITGKATPQLAGILAARVDAKD